VILRCISTIEIDIYNDRECHFVRGGRGRMVNWWRWRQRWLCCSVANIPTTGTASIAMRVIHTLQVQRCLFRALCAGGSGAVGLKWNTSVTCVLYVLLYLVVSNCVFSCRPTVYFFCQYGSSEWVSRMNAIVGYMESFLLTHLLSRPRPTVWPKK